MSEELSQLHQWALDKVRRELSERAKEYETISVPKSFIPETASLVECYETATEYIIIGTPESDDETHDCDAMGCGTLSHVMARIPKAVATGRAKE